MTTKRPGVLWTLRNWIHYRRRDLPKIVAGRFAGLLPGLLTVEARLLGRVLHADGRVTDYGVLSTRVVTNVGVQWLVDAFQGLVEPELARFHGYGTGSTAENVADTGLVAELTTEYAVASTRPTGSQTEGASPNIYRSVATLVPTAPVTIAEHMLTTQAAVGGGVAFDRSVFAGVPLGIGDQFQTTWELTIAAGG